MRLGTYLLRKFLLYFLVINGSLALLYNLVDFLEKIVRLSSAPISSIIMYVIFSVLPTFFDLIPISTPIALVLFLKDLNDRNEWETIFLVGIRPLRIVIFMLYAGCILSAASFIGKEVLASSLAQQAEKIRLQDLKGEQEKKLFDTTLMITHDSVIHFDFLDQQTSQGSGFSYVSLTPAFSLKTVIEAPHFSCDESSQTILLPSAIETDIEHNREIHRSGFSLSSPDFFKRRAITTSGFTLKGLVTNVIVAHSLDNRALFNLELGGLLDRLLRHLQPLMYTIALLVLFLFFIQSFTLRWAILIAPYPLFIIATNITTFAVHHGGAWWVVMLPYIIACGILALMLRLLDHHTLQSSTHAA